MLYSYGKKWESIYLAHHVLANHDPFVDWSPSEFGTWLECAVTEKRLVIPLNCHPGDVITGIKLLWSCEYNTDNYMHIQLAPAPLFPPFSDFSPFFDDWGYAKTSPNEQHTDTFAVNNYEVPDNSDVVLLLTGCIKSGMFYLWGIGVEKSVRVY